MRSNRRSRILASAALLVLATGLAACAATRERRGVPEPSGFLGSTYSLLAPNADFPASEVYVAPGIDWASFDSVQIDSVTLWVDKADSKLSPEDQQMLTDTFFKAIHEAVSASFAVVDHPGAGTIRLRAALTQAKGSPVALRAITTIVPQLRVATTLVGLSADTAVTVGSATAEIELRDSITGNLLAAAVDSRAGNKALFSSRTFTKWGDVEAAQKLWAERIAWQLARHGVQRKPGAPMPKEPSA
jgi:hypothetical protein